jgi:hypothetical protein
MVTACGAEAVAHAMVNFSNAVEESTEFGSKVHYGKPQPLHIDGSIDPRSVKKCLDVLTILQLEFPF